MLFCSNNLNISIEIITKILMIFTLKKNGINAEILSR